MTDARAGLLSAVLDGVIAGDPRASEHLATAAIAGDPAWAGALLSYALFMQQRWPDAARAADAALGAAADPVGLAIARAARGLASAGVDDRVEGGPDPLRDLADALPAGADDTVAFVRYLGAEAALAGARLHLAATIVADSGAPGIQHAYGAVELVMRARLHAFQGRIADAAAVLATRPPDLPVLIEVLADATDGLIRGNAAERSRVRASADRIEALRPGVDGYLASGCSLLVAFGLVAVGDTQRAARLALAAGGDPSLSRLTVIDRALTFELLVAAAELDDDPDAAEAWADRAAELSGSPIAGSTVDRLTSRVVLMRGRAEDAVILADRAVERARLDGRVVEAAEGEIVAARARIAASRPGEAAARLQSMVSETDTSGYSAARRSASRELRAIGRRLRPAPGSEWSGLTERERAIALMVAEGLGNRAIATALHLSEHTVRAHVTRVLAAFGAASRSRVAAQIAGMLPPIPVPAAPLTTRQLSVAVKVAEGAGNAEIAAQLGVSVKTVEKHVGEILARWQMPSRVAIARAARSLPTAHELPNKP